MNENIEVLCTKRTLRPRCTSCGAHTWVTTLTDEEGVQYDTRGLLMAGRQVFCASCAEKLTEVPPPHVVDGLITMLRKSRMHHANETQFTDALARRDVVELTRMLLTEAGDGR